MEKTRKSPNLAYSSFMFLKLDPAFRRLISNEKIAAKQEFENLVASCQEKIFLRTYLVSGLRSDCDVLFWRMSQDLDFLQELCARTFSAGIGRWLLPTHSFLGIHTFPDGQRKDLDFGFLPRDLFGRHKYMLLHPVIKTHSWYDLSEEERTALQNERLRVLARHADIQENMFMSYGLDEQEMLVVREARSLSDLAAATKELREQRIKRYTSLDRPVFFCVGRDLRDILDAIN
ncbi:MAG TPA: chlorite dismutase family protein [Elusimicrobiales bacterium]|nr:chlorite dismutase family protein [Elusimicrobiales bacterium]